MSGYAYLWEYRIRAERSAEFEAAYGPEGDWVRLFGRASGHLRTARCEELTESERELGDFAIVD